MRHTSFYIVVLCLVHACCALAYEVNFDCGGGGCSNDGRIFAADISYPGTQNAGYLPGSVQRPKISQSNSGGPYQPVYICDWYRWGNIGYQFDVPNGDYVVTLYFNEWEYHGPGMREFSISIEGETQVPAFDIWQRARMFYAFGVRYLATVSDGVLDVALAEGNNYAMLAAISVEDVTDDGSPPDPIWNLMATDTYNAVLLTWSLPDADEVQQVNVYRAEAPEGPFSVIATREDLAPYWVDHTAVVGTTYYYRITATDLFGREGTYVPVASGTALDPATSTLPMYEITVDPDSLLALQTNYTADYYYSGALDLGLMHWDNVGVRYRGALSRIISSKKSWKVRFYGLDELDGKDRLNINADYQDFTMIVSAASFACFKDVRCKSSDTAKSNLLVNDEYRGIFTEIEPVDNVFLQKRGITQVGNLYKCKASLQLMDPSQIPFYYEKKTNSGSTYDDLIAFIDAVNLTPLSELDDVLFPQLDVDGLIDYYAMRIFFGDDDFFWQNYYLYHHLQTDVWEFIPWDLDASFHHWTTNYPINLGTQGEQSANGWNRLFDRVLQVPKFQRRYCDRLQEIMAHTFDQTRFEALTDSLAAVVTPDVDRDFWKLRFDHEFLFPSHLDLTKNFRGQRIDYLSSAIAPFLSGVNGLFINEVLVVNDSVIADDALEYDSYIELYNWTDDPVLLSDYSLTDGTGDPLDDVLPAVTIAPRDFALFWADGQPGQGTYHLDFTLPPGGGSLMLYATDDLTTAVDSLTYAAQEADIAHGVYVDGWWPFQSMPPTPEAPNVQFAPEAELFINEFLAINSSTNQDPQGHFDDWIELYNPAGEDVDLTGYFLTDDLGDPTRWPFPEGTIIPAGGFLLVWCDNDTLDPGLHANFRLSGSGEAIGLHGPAHLGVPTIDSYIFGVQVADVSTGRFPDGGETWFAMENPTPGGPNDAGLAVDDPEGVASRFALYPAYPNPTAGVSTIGFFVPGSQSTVVSLEMFDLRGRRVRQLVADPVAPGAHTVTWDRRDDDGNPLASGVYFYRLDAGNFTQTRKIILVR